MANMILPTFSDKIFGFALTESWELLTQEQIWYVLFALVRFNAVEVKTYLFVRFTGIKVLRHQADGWVCHVTTDKGIEVDFFLHTWQIESFSRCFDFVTESPRTPVYIHALGEFQAVDKLLREVPFKEYLTIENCYQGYLCTHEDKRLTSMTTLLYANDAGRHPHPEAVTAEHRLSSSYGTRQSNSS